MHGVTNVGLDIFWPPYVQCGSLLHRYGVIMELQNKLGLIGAAFEDAEERISKQRAKEMFDSGALDTLEAGTYASLQAIHRCLFEDIYDFAGDTRKLNLSNGSFRFTSAIYLDEALAQISAIMQSTYKEIIAKYVEMNIAHPFWEGNGRSTRIWLDAILKKELGVVIDWSKVDRVDYLLAMERSPVRDTEVRLLLKEELTDKTADRAIFMHGIDASYRYEGYQRYKTEDL